MAWSWEVALDAVDCLAGEASFEGGGPWLAQDWIEAMDKYLGELRRGGPPLFDPDMKDRAMELWRTVPAEARELIRTNMAELMGEEKSG